MNSTIARIQTQKHSDGLTLEAHPPLRPHQVFPLAHLALHSQSPVAKSDPIISRNDGSLASGAIRSVTLCGPSGRLEGVLNLGSPHAQFAALVCHPHPLGGGNLHNRVVYHAMKALNDPEWGFGWPVLRFNFRGTGLSEGLHDGEAEAADVLAALNWFEREFHLPLILAGFSFGAAMALRAGATRRPPQEKIRALIALGLPILSEFAAYHYPYLNHLTVPKLFLSGDHDQFASAAELVHTAASAAEPRRLILVPGADHFFTEHLEPMQNALAGWLKEELG